MARLLRSVMLIRRESLRAAWYELRGATPAWGELVLSSISVVSGVWSYWLPYASEWIQAPAFACGTFFLAVGLFQLLAFLAHDYHARRAAAAVAAAAWVGVFIILCICGAQGLLFGLTVVQIFAQIAIFEHLRHLMEHRT